MRLADRLRRLERAVTADDGDRMTEAEIAAAEASMRRKVDAFAAAAQPGDPVITLAGMMALVRDRDAPGWLQRVRANMGPEELFV